MPIRQWIKRGNNHPSRGAEDPHSEASILKTGAAVVNEAPTYFCSACSCSEAPVWLTVDVARGSEDLDSVPPVRQRERSWK